MSDKKAETKDHWDGDTSAMTETVQHDPGYYAVVSSAPTVLDADVELLDGAVVARGDVPAEDAHGREVAPAGLAPPETPGR
jgi:hypothetical protein